VAPEETGLEKDFWTDQIIIKNNEKQK